MRVRLALPFLLLMAGCTPDFDEIWQVKDLRILAIRSTPPEVLVPLGVTEFPAVRIDALIVDPQAPAGAIFDWELWACTADETRCEIADRQVLVRRGQAPLEGIAADFTLDSALAQAALEADPLKGFGGVAVMVELRVGREGLEARAVKRVVYGYPIPPQKTANSNPSFKRMMADGEEVFPPLVVEPNRQVKLLPESSAEAKEKYWVATYTGGSRELTEYLSYAFFVTSGRLSDPVTGGKPSPFVQKTDLEDLSVEWTPTALGEDTVWVVVHDDRGGVGWTSFRTISK